MLSSARLAQPTDDRNCTGLSFQINTSIIRRSGPVETAEMHVVAKFSPLEIPYWLTFSAVFAYVDSNLVLASEVQNTRRLALPTSSSSATRSRLPHFFFHLFSECSFVAFLLCGLGLFNDVPSATDGRRRRLNYPYVLQCSEAITFHGY